jgi:hypothetical protein
VSADATGGPGTINITIDPECTWNVASDSDWIIITSATSGQGSGRADFRLAANSTLTTRHGQISVNAAKVTVDEAGCAFALAQTNQSVPAQGGAGSVGITAGAACPWSAVSNADWITITGGSSGTGAGSVAFSVAPNTGPARSGTLTIAGQAFTVNQDAASSSNCAAVIAPTSQGIGAGGGSGTVGVTDGPGCAWTATSNAAWITIASGASGTGNGTVTYNVASTTTSRSGTLTIAGQTFTVIQNGPGSPNCFYSIDQTVFMIAAGGGSGTVHVTTESGCMYTADPNAGWITVTSGRNGNGSGTVIFTAAGNTGPQRTGSVVIAGQSVMVTQGDGCAFTLNPPGGQTVPASSGSYPVMITASNPSCGWTAAVTANFAGGGLSVAPASGTGSGTVTFTVTGNTGPARMGILTIGRQTFTVTQMNGCAFSLNPTSNLTVLVAGGTNFTVDVTPSNSMCTWTATVDAAYTSWIHITSGSMYTGHVMVHYNVDMNSGGPHPRDGYMTIANASFHIRQQ